MFVIRSAQFETLADAAREPFRGRVLTFIRETIPERTRGMTEDELKARVADADRRAVGHGLKTERGICLFAALNFLVGPRFDEKPEVRAVLALPQPDQDLKIRWFVKALAIYREGRESEAGMIRKVAEGGQQFLGSILAALLSPFFLCADGVLRAGISYAPEAESAIPAVVAAAEVIGAGLLVAGEALLAIATSPVTLTVLAVAVVAVGIYVLANQAKKVDDAADDASGKKAPSDVEECPKDEAKTPDPEEPEGEDPEGKDDPPEDKGKFADEAKLNDHFERHGDDFGAKTPEEYEAQADKFNNGPKDPEVLEKTRPNGDVVRYNPETDEFGVSKSDGTIKTYYKPDPAVHGYPTNLDYFNAQ